MLQSSDEKHGKWCQTAVYKKQLGAANRRVLSAMCDTHRIPQHDCAGRHDTADSRRLARYKFAPHRAPETEQRFPRRMGRAQKRPHPTHPPLPFYRHSPRKEMTFRSQEQTRRAIKPLNLTRDSTHPSPLSPHKHNVILPPTCLPLLPNIRAHKYLTAAPEVALVRALNIPRIR